MTKKKKAQAPANTDVLEAIREAYLEDVVSDDVLHIEESYYDAICEEVRAALRAITTADVLYDRPPDGRLHWEEGSDPGEDAPDWSEDSSSYDLLFLGLRGEQFTFEGETEEEEMPDDDDEPITVKVSCEGCVGCAVGISLVAPFAVVRFTEKEWTETGSETMPDIWPSAFDLNFKPLDMEAHDEELYLEERIEALRNLRAEITRVLEGFGIRVLTEQELGAEIPGLKPNPTRNQWEQKETANVSEALFFRTP